VELIASPAWLHPDKDTFPHFRLNASLAEFVRRRTARFVDGRLGHRAQPRIQQNLLIHNKLQAVDYGRQRVLLTLDPEPCSSPQSF
jgi:hypothetical protein